MPEQFAFAEHIVPVLALIISIFTYYAAVRERHHKSAAEAAGLKNDIATIKGDISDVKIDLAKLDDNYHADREEIVALKGRIKACEDKINALEREVHHG